MKISVCLPYHELEYSRATTLEWCQAIDQGPFASVGCGQRLTSYAQDMPVLLAAAAALTERVRIVPSLYVLPLQSAVAAAKQTASLDVLSGGRLTVGVGIGGRDQDYRAVGAPLERRLQRLDAGVAIMKSCWRGEEPVPGVGPIGPTPVQPGGPPLWAGAMGPKAIRRAAEWADGIYGFCMNGDPAPAYQQKQLSTEAWADAGRGSKPYLVTGFWYSLAGDADRRLKQYVYEYLKVAGDAVARLIAETMTCSTPDTVRRALDALQATGVDECFLVPATPELVEIERLSRLVA